MKIGVVGLGKVGLVLAQVLRHVGGHEVIGYDVRSADAIYDDLDAQREPIPQGPLTIAADMRTVILASNVVYVCVATPNVDFDATQPYSIEAEDFDYTALINAVSEVSEEAVRQRKPITLIVLSTVAPGTFMERIYDAVESDFVSLVYSPSFISLGTVENDLIAPRAILAGVVSSAATAVIEEVWKTVTDAPVISVSVESAEIIKMASNTLQFFKIQYINALAQLADKTLADMDEVSDGLDRVLNHGWIPKAGMPDGGACRPRDVAAMHEIAEKYGLRQLTTIMDGLGNARKNQFTLMAEDVRKLASRRPGVPILILGDAYKAGVNYTDGSPGVALFQRLQQSAGERNVSLVPSGFTGKLHDVAIYVIAVPFAVDLNQFPEGSVVYDVWGTTKGDLTHAVTYISPGRTNGF